MWVYALLVAMLTGLVAWLEYYPASPMITAVGLPGPRADTDRRCGSMYRQLPGPGSYGFRIHGPGDLVYQWRPERRRSYPRVIRYPTRLIVCQGSSGLESRHESQNVSLDVITRRTSRVQRVWYLEDSASWKRARDSIASAMMRLGGRDLACRTFKPPRRPIPDTSAGPVGEASRRRGFAIPDTWDMRSWQFPEYSIRLIVFRMHGDITRAPWRLQVDGYPGPPPGCV